MYLLGQGIAGVTGPGQHTDSALHPPEVRAASYCILIDHDAPLSSLGGGGCTCTESARPHVYRHHQFDAICGLQQVNVGDAKPQAQRDYT
jgi:hypothetical protein